MDEIDSSANYEDDIDFNTIGGYIQFWFLFASFIYHHCHYLYAHFPCTHGLNSAVPRA